MKTVIAGLEEGLNAIAEALEGGGGSSIVPTPTAQDEGKVLTAGDDGSASWETPEGGIPTPTLDDEGKVLQVIPQTQTTVAPEWATIRQVPTGGQAGQVLTKNSGGYGWAAASGGLPSLYEEDNGKALIAQYDSDTETTYPAWSIIKQVPSGGTVGQVLTKTSGSGYAWQAASGGGNIDVVKFDVAQASFTQDGQVYKTHFASDDGNILTKINNMISITIVDNVDGGYPSLIRPATDECSIWYEDDLVFIRISSTVYSALGTRQANHFYMTYYTGA